jgi:hypothetical protein
LAHKDYKANFLKDLLLEIKEILMQALTKKNGRRERHNT